MRDVFAGLDRLEEILSHQRYLTGSNLTEADVRLYTTLARFDLVYVGCFKVSQCPHQHPQPKLIPLPQQVGGGLLQSLSVRTRRG